jgi:PASTA domain
MKASRHTTLLKWTALAGVCAAVAATSAQAGGPPADPGWAGIPHCTVPQIEGKQLAAARKSLRGSLCGVLAPLRKRSTAARNTVLTAIPEEGTNLAPGTKVLLIVAK